VSDVTIDDVVEEAPYVFALVKAGSVHAVKTGLETLPGLTVHIDLAHKDSPGMMSVQVTDIGSNKYHAIEALRSLLHSNKMETLAIGDSHNDIPLFMNAGIRVAMGNAVDELKQRADHVVGTIEADGFAEAMQKFVLT
jgi:hydroxymethylpyrimidine pyrophosphatase-like HAD family hydrolase